MFNHEHALRETAEYFSEVNKRSEDKYLEEQTKRNNEVQEYYDLLNKVREQRELKDSELGKFKEAVYDNHLETALEAIYISALEKVAPLTEETTAIAKNMVSNYIQENGGAREIMRTRSGKTYLLDTIFEAVESAAQKDIKLFFEAEKDDEEEDKKKKEADGSDEVDKEDIKLGDADGDGVDDSQDSDFGTGEDNDKNEEASDSKEKADEEDEKDEEEKPSSSEENEEETEDESEESEEDNDDSENDDEEDAEVSVDDLDAEEVEDDEEGEEDESDPVLDEPDTKETIEDSGEESPIENSEDEPEEDMATSKEELFDKLENDAEVSDAVDIIAKRISDAEAKFIEKNAEDKKKIENIVNKVQDRIDAVTQDEDSSNEDIEAEEQEAKIETARLITQIREDRPHTILECVVRDNMDYIIKNKALNESYTSEDGKIDMTRVMDNSRTMYGWLETVNTIQLDKVNEDYLKKVLEGKI